MCFWSYGAAWDEQTNVDIFKIANLVQLEHRCARDICITSRNRILLRLCFLRLSLREAQPFASGTILMWRKSNWTSRRIFSINTRGKYHRCLWLFWFSRADVRLCHLFYYRRRRPRKNRTDIIRRPLAYSDLLASIILSDIHIFQNYWYNSEFEGMLPRESNLLGGKPSRRS